MATLQSKISKAKEAGYSDEEIVKYVSSLPGYETKTQKAIDQGYKPDEIVSFLSSQPDIKPSMRKNVAAEEPKGGALAVFDALSALPKFAGAEAIMALQRGAKSAGGALAGAAAIPERGLGLAKEAGLGILQDRSVGEPGATEAALRQMTGAPAGDLYFGGGKLAGEMAATAGIPAAIARGGAKVLPAAAQTPAVNRLLAAIESGGLGEAGGANYLQRVLGGGIAGAVPGFLMGGTEGASFAGGLGAAIPGAVGIAAPLAAPLTSRVPQAVGYLSEKVSQFRQPEKAALAQATGDKIESIISALGTEGAIVPGTQPHAGEVAAKAGSTGFSALIAKTFRDVPEIQDILQDRQATNMLARDLYNRGLFQSADQAERTLLDAAGKQGMETDLLGTMGQRMEAERNILAKEAEDVAAGVREPSQMKVGQEIKEKRSELIKDIQTKTINPLFEKAKEYPTPFDVTDVKGVVDDIAKQNTKFAESLNPKAAEIINRLQPKLASKWRIDEQGNYFPETYSPPSITMEDAVELNKALNRQLGMLSNSEIPGAGQTIIGINKIKQALNAAIKKNVPEEFSKAFDDANASYSSLIAKPFKETEFEKLRLTGTAGQPLLQPSDVAERILARPEYAQQFVTQMKDSPAALDAAAEGIEGLFRSKAVVEGRIKPDAAARFLKDNKEALDILKQGGVDIESRLAGLAAQGRTADLAAELAKKTREPLEKFTSPEGLRSGLRSKPELMDTAAKYLGTEERKGLSRGMLMDAFEDTSDATAHLMKNQKAIKKALELGHPGKSDRMFLEAVNAAQLYDDVLKNQKLIGDLDPAITTKQRQEKIAELTKGLTPQEMRDVTAIQKDLARVQRFEDLAKAGIAPKKGIVDDLFTDLELPPVFNRIVTVAKRAMQVTKNKLSRIKSAELAAAFLEPKMTKQLLEETRAWQAETLKKKAAATAGTKKAMEKTAAAGRGAARAAVLGTANAMAPESNNQNALMR